MSNIKVWECLRCGHQWASRMDCVPRNCAKCKSTAWQTKRRTGYIDTLRGARRWPEIHDIQPGQTIKIDMSYCHDEDTFRKEHTAVENAMLYEIRKFKKRLFMEHQPLSVTIYRHTT